MNPAPIISRDEDLVLAYGSRSVLSGISLELRAGERWVVIGANGAGKSTYLRSYVQPSLIRGGRRELSLAPAARVLLSQQARLSWSVPCSARDFLLNSLALKRGVFARPDARERAAVDEALVGAGLSDRAERPLAELSGGQTQKLLLARALLLEARLLLLDEPFSAVDADGKEDLWRRLDACLPGTCQLLVLHDVFDILRARGRLLEAADGTLRERSWDDFRRRQERNLDVVLSR